MHIRLAAAAMAAAMSVTLAGGSRAEGLTGPPQPVKPADTTREYLPEACAANPAPLPTLPDRSQRRSPRRYLPPRNGPSDFLDGRLVSRGCHVERLRQEGVKDDARFTEVSQRASEISRLYLARAGRQQIWTDAASQGVQLGGLGYLLSKGAGTSTQAYWGYATVGIVMVAQFNAYEPTKDLFFGGSLGVELIQSRYQSIHTARRQLKALADASENDRKAVDAQCSALAEAQKASAGWKNNRGDKVENDADLRKLAAACEAYPLAADTMLALAGSPALGDENLARLEARDLVALDANLVSRDQALRATPLKTLTRLAAFPLQAAATFVSGENGAKAIEGLKTQAAFDNLDLALNKIPAPEIPDLSAEGGPLKTALGDRLKDTIARGKTGPTDAEVGDFADTAELTRRRLVLFDVRFKQMRELAQVISENAQAERLNFTYNATTSAVTVTLAKPASTTTVKQAGSASEPAT